MTPLMDLQQQLAEAQVCLASLEQAERKMREGHVPPLAFVRRLSRARTDVRRLEAEMRACRVDEAQDVRDGRIT